MPLDSLCRSKLRAAGLILATVAAPVARGNVVGNDTQNFNPVAGAADFVTVQSSATLAPGRFNLGLFVDDASNTLPYHQTAGDSKGHINDSIVGMDVGVGVGLLPGFELGVAAPFVAHQSVDDETTRGEFAQNGNTGVRLVAKWAALHSGRFGLALVESASVDRTQDDPNTGASNAGVLTSEIAADTHAGNFTFGANAGYRARQAEDKVPGALVAPIGNEYIASLAAAYKLSSMASLIAETYGSRPVVSPYNETDRTMSSAEATFGARYAVTPALAAHAGIGAGLLHGLSTPDWRVYAGFVTEFGPGAGQGSRGHVVAKDRERAKPRQATQPAPEPAAAAEIPNEEAKAMIPDGKPDAVFILRNINFEFDSDHRVLPGALTELQKLADQVASHPYARIVVEGHCDYMGSDAYNDDLSTRRARTVRHALILHHGFDAEKLVAVGFGKRHPLTSDPSDAGRQLNRRVEIKVYWNDVAHH